MKEMGLKTDEEILKMQQQKQLNLAFSKQEFEQKYQKQMVDIKYKKLQRIMKKE